MLLPSGVPTWPCKDIKSLEDIQKFALKVCTKKWDENYTKNTLLTMCNLSTLADRRKTIRLCLLFKMSSCTQIIAKLLGRQ